jgi:hypothetical protein
MAVITNAPAENRDVATSFRIGIPMGAFSTIKKPLPRQKKPEIRRAAKLTGTRGVTIAQPSGIVFSVGGLRQSIEIALKITS